MLCTEASLTRQSCVRPDRNPYLEHDLDAPIAEAIAVGFSGLAAGGAIGLVGDAGTRSTSLQPKLFVGMILILIFAEALGLYGLIVALVMSGASCTA